MEQDFKVKDDATVEDLMPPKEKMKLKSAHSHIVELQHMGTKDLSDFKHQIDGHVPFLFLPTAV